VFLAENVPACGYKTFYLSRSESSGPARTEVRTGVGPVENEFYRLRMHPETAALEVVDKQRGVKLGAPEIGGLGEVVFYDTEPKLDWTANRPLGKRHEWEVSGQDLQYSQGPVHASLRAKGNFGPHRVSREARLTRGSRRIEYLVEIDAEDGSGVFCMRFPSGLSGRVSAGIPFGVEPRDHLEKEPFRCEYFVTGYPDAYYAHRWSDVSSEKYGYTYVCPPGIHTGYFYREEDRALQFMLLRVRPMPTRSPWHQVHPSIQGKGHHAWRSALLPHDGTWREASSHRHALEQHVPLLAFSPGTGIRRVRLDEPAPSPAGDSLAESASFVEISPSGVVLSSLRLVASEEKGKSPQWELRLYETLGNATDVVVRLGCPVARARRTNLLGEPSEDGGKIELAGNEIRFRILPWKIVTLRATPGKNRVDANQ